MKAITTTIYVCGGLMAVAAVMGAIDYKVAQQKGIFKTLYKEEKPVVVNNKEVDFEDYSRGKINDIEVKEEASKANKTKSKKHNIETVSYKPPVIVDDKKALPTEKYFNKRRVKFSPEIFSRAPLPRREYHEEEIKKITIDTAKSTTEN